jgi:hypothetical protein
VEVGISKVCRAGRQALKPKEKMMMQLEYEDNLEAEFPLHGKTCTFFS